MRPKTDQHRRRAAQAVLVSQWQPRQSCRRRDGCEACLLVLGSHVVSGVMPVVRLNRLAARTKCSRGLGVSIRLHVGTISSLQICSISAWRLLTIEFAITPLRCSAYAVERIEAMLSNSGSLGAHCILNILDITFMSSMPCTLTAPLITLYICLNMVLVFRGNLH